MKTINETFTCITCHRQICKAKKTCRNHCPYCFTSLHVDDTIPGDRLSQCGGVMFPQTFTYHTNGVRILFVCTKCGKKHRNKQAHDDDITILQQKIIQYQGQFMS